MRGRLRFLYGDELGDRTFAELEQLLARFRGRLGPREPTRRGFDERDAILITYGDTLLSSDRAPLRALGEFAARHLAGRVSGVHVDQAQPSIPDQIAQLAKLRDQGLVTDAEFQAKKADLLGRL